MKKITLTQLSILKDLMSSLNHEAEIAERLVLNTSYIEKKANDLVKLINEINLNNQ